MIVTGEALELARRIWSFLFLGHTPIKADVIVALGTNDLRVAEFAAGLFAQGYGSKLVCTGGIAHVGDLLATAWDRSEAEMYAAVAEEHGVPREHILLETRALNTAENIRFTRQLLRERGIHPANIVLAVKPFMQRRTWAAMVVEWPEMAATVASEPMTLDEYFTAELSATKIINIMMGDLQRVWVYAEKGWSAPQRIPDDVRAAYDRLSEMGFTKHLLAGV